MRVLVTGGSGFIGTNLVDALTGKHDVRTYDLNRPMNEAHRQFWTQGSINDLQCLSLLYREFQPEIVFHLAARTDLHGSSLSDYAANIEGVRNVIAAGTLLEKRPHTLYASSRLVFDIAHRPSNDFDYKPTTPYGESKVNTELIIRSEASSAGTWSIVRPTSIWGPWFGVPYRDFFDTVKRGRYVRIAGCNPRKSYGFVGNSVHQLMQLAAAPRDLVDKRVFWLTDYPAIVLDDWANTIAEHFDVRRPRRVPYWLLALAARTGDIAKYLGYKEPPITTFRLTNLLTEMTYDARSTEEIVGPLPYSTEEGVRLTVEWMNSSGSRPNA